MLPCWYFSDNVPLKIDGVLYAQIVDPYKVICFIITFLIQFGKNVFTHIVLSKFKDPIVSVADCAHHEQRVSAKSQPFTFIFFTCGVVSTRASDEIWDCVRKKRRPATMQLAVPYRIVG